MTQSYLEDISHYTRNTLKINLLTYSPVAQSFLGDFSAGTGIYVYYV